MNKNEVNCRLQFDNFIVKSCQCYENYWRTIRESNPIKKFFNLIILLKKKTF